MAPDSASSPPGAFWQQGIAHHQRQRPPRVLHHLQQGQPAVLNGEAVHLTHLLGRHRRHIHGRAQRIERKSVAVHAPSMCATGGGVHRRRTPFAKIKRFPLRVLGQRSPSPSHDFCPSPGGRRDGPGGLPHWPLAPLAAVGPLQRRGATREQRRRTVLALRQPRARASPTRALPAHLPPHRLRRSGRAAPGRGGPLPLRARPPPLGRPRRGLALKRAARGVDAPGCIGGGQGERDTLPFQGRWPGERSAVTCALSVWAGREEALDLSGADPPGVNSTKKPTR